MQPLNPKKFLSRIDEATLAAMELVTYTYPTKIGYWEANRGVKEEKMAILRIRRKQCKTLTIRLNLMNENLLHPGQLSMPNRYIHYNDAIQITIDKKQVETGIKECVLAALITEKDIDATVNLCHGSPVLASTYKKPCRRNLFKILDPKNMDKKDVRINYGDDIYIAIHDPGFQDRRLYLQAIVPTFDTFGGSSDHFKLRLSECLDRYCKFKIIPKELEKRDVCKGDYVPSNKTICITHTVSNRFLVTEKTLIPTLFGPEREISCFNYKSNNKELPSNLWELTIQKQKELIKPNQSN